SSSSIIIAWQNARARSVSVMAIPPHLGALYAAPVSLARSLRAPLHINGRWVLLALYRVSKASSATVVPLEAGFLIPLADTFTVWLPTASPVFAYTSCWYWRVGLYRSTTTSAPSTTT